MEGEFVLHDREVAVPLHWTARSDRSARLTIGSSEQNFLLRVQTPPEAKRLAVRIAGEALEGRATKAGFHSAKNGYYFDPKRGLLWARGGVAKSGQQFEFYWE